MEQEEKSNLIYQDSESVNLVSIIIPFFNEEEIIGPLERRLTDVLGGCNYNFEIVVVDDGSSDGTLERLRDWQTRDKGIVIIKLSRNWGHQNAFNAGLDVAQGKAIIFMDGDLEDPPEVITELLKEWEDGFDTVYTVKSSRHQKAGRRLLTNVYYRLIKASNPVGVEPQAGMFSLIDQKVASILRQMKESNKSYPNLRSFSGFSQKKVIYSREPRPYGKSRQTIKRLITDGFNAIFSNSYAPIRIFTVLGLIFSIFFFVIGAIVLVVRITGTEFWIFRDIPGTQMILLTVLLIGALQLTFLGIIGEYIARIYEESKGRPYYVIEEIERVDSA